MFKQLYTNMCQSFIFRLLEEIKPLEGLQGQCKDFKLWFTDSQSQNLKKKTEVGEIGITGNTSNFMAPSFCFRQRQVIKCFLAGSFLGFSCASGMCWHAGETVGIYLWCQPLSGLLIHSPVDWNNLPHADTKEQGPMGLQRHYGIMRGGQRGCSTSTELTRAKEFFF